MAYTNGFPIGYQTPQYFYPQPQMPQSQTQNQSNSSIIWVQGEAGAKSYLVAPNNTIQLWDSERQTIYLKSADASGMPSMKILDYTIRQENTHQAIPAAVQQETGGVSKKDLDALQGQIDALKEKIRQLTPVTEVKDE